MAFVLSVILKTIREGLYEERYCGVVGLWGCGVVGLWGCGVVGLWGCGVVFTEWRMAWQVYFSRPCVGQAYAEGELHSEG
jgi:hypothetical protein